MLLVKDGSARATIVTGSSPSPAEAAAARELQTYLWKLATAAGQAAEKLPIETEAAAPPGTLIYVGRSAAVTRLGVSVDDLEMAHSFTIRTHGDSLVLCGKGDLGTEYAVYTFLERYCGVRWLWPGEMGECIPPRRTIEIGAICDREDPDFTLRVLGSMAPLPEGTPEPLWKKRNKVLTVSGYVPGHNWAKLVPPDKYGPTHPEYFALVNGSREQDWNAYDGQHGYQLCTTNPEVVRLSIDHVRRFFDEHPDVDIYSIDANDGAGWCECANCQALDTGKVRTIPSSGGAEDGSEARPVVTDRIYTFVNEIAAAVKQTHPDKYVLHLAYSDYIEPPERVRPLDNVVVQITLNCECHYDPAYKEDQWRLIRAWSHVTPNLMLYEYFNHTWKLQLPRAIPRAVGAAIPYYRQCGARFFSAQASDDFGNEGLTLYLAAKLLWDTGLDADELVADYCEHAFAEGAALGRRYFARLEALWDAALAELGPRWGGNPHVYLTMLTPETIAELKGYLTAALQLAQSAAAQERIRFFLDGWRFYAAEVAAFRHLRGLAEEGIITYPVGAPSWQGAVSDLTTLDVSEAEARRRIAETIRAWEERDQAAERLDGRFIIDVERMRAWNCIDWRFHPVAHLQRALHPAAAK